MLGKFLDNENTPRYKISLKGVGMTKGKSVGFSMMLKIGTEVGQHYTVLNYGPPNPLKDLNSQGRTTVDQAGMKPEPIFFSKDTAKRKLGMNPPICVDRGYLGKILGYHSG